MKPKFTPNFNINDIRKVIIDKVNRVELVTLDQLKQIGEQFIIDARSTNTYKDRTGNLRHSIGYVILKDGVEIFGSFSEPGQELVKDKEGKSKPLVGASIAKKLAITIGEQYPVGYVLIVVAGMSYAGYVEAKGYDVLTGSSLSAETNLVRSINKIAERLKRMRA